MRVEGPMLYTMFDHVLQVTSNVDRISRTFLMLYERFVGSQNMPANRPITAWTVTAESTSHIRFTKNERLVYELVPKANARDMWLLRCSSPRRSRIAFAAEDGVDLDPARIAAEVITEDTLGAISGRFFVHGGALQSDSSGLLVHGKTGSGKSTLCLGLTAAGCKLLSDDVACIDLSSGFLDPFPRAVSLDAKTLGLLRALPFRSPAWDFPSSTNGKQLVDVEQLYPESVGTRSPISHVFHLSGYASAPHIEPVTSLLGVKAAVGAARVVDAVTARSFAYLYPALQDAHFYEVHLGRLIDTVAAIVETMNETRSR